MFSNAPKMKQTRDEDLATPEAIRYRITLLEKEPTAVNAKRIQRLKMSLPGYVPPADRPTPEASATATMAPKSNDWREKPVFPGDSSSLEWGDCNLKAEKVAIPAFTPAAEPVKAAPRQLSQAERIEGLKELAGVMGWAKGLCAVA